MKVRTAIKNKLIEEARSYVEESKTTIVNILGEPEYKDKRGDFYSLKYSSPTAVARTLNIPLKSKDELNDTNKQKEFAAVVSEKLSEKLGYDVEVNITPHLFNYGEQREMGLNVRVFIPVSEWKSTSGQVKDKKVADKINNDIPTDIKKHFKQFEKANDAIRLITDDAKRKLFKSNSYFSIDEIKTKTDKIVGLFKQLNDDIKSIIK